MAIRTYKYKGVINIHAPCRFFETDKVSIYKAFHCGIVNGGAGAKIVYSPEHFFVTVSYGISHFMSKPNTGIQLLNIITATKMEIQYRAIPITEKTARESIPPLRPPRCIHAVHHLTVFETVALSIEVEVIDKFGAEEVVSCREFVGSVEHMLVVGAEMHSVAGLRLVLPGSGGVEEVFGVASGL